MNFEQEKIGDSICNPYEQVLQDCDYVFRETAEIAGRSIEVYEKKGKLDYAKRIDQLSANSREAVLDVVEEINKNLILIDGFGGDHAARRKWMDTLKGKDRETYAIYEEQSKLRMNRATNISMILQVMVRGTKDENLKSTLEELLSGQKELKYSTESKIYQNLSLSEKVLYMEEVDKRAENFLEILLASKKEAAEI